MLHFWATKVEILHLHAKTGADPTAMQQDAVACLAKKLQEIKHLPSSDAKAMLDLVNTAPLTAPLKELCGELLGAKLTTPRAERQGHETLQVHEYMAEYLTAEDWSKLEDPRLDPGQKLYVLGRRAVKIGLLHPSEHTARNIVAIKTLLQQDEQDQAKQLEDLRDFKKVGKSSRHSMLQAPPRYPDKLAGSPE